MYHQRTYPLLHCRLDDIHEEAGVLGEPLVFFLLLKDKSRALDCLGRYKYFKKISVLWGFTYTKYSSQQTRLSSLIIKNIDLYVFRKIIKISSISNALSLLRRVLNPYQLSAHCRTTNTDLVATAVGLDFPYIQALFGSDVDHAVPDEGGELGY